MSAVLRLIGILFIYLGGIFSIIMLVLGSGLWVLTGVAIGIALLVIAHFLDKRRRR